MRSIAVSWQLLMDYFNFFLFVLAVFALPISLGVTDSRDVYAINDMYAALGSPQLTGWTNAPGDPCGLAWQGVLCVGANVTGIVLKSLNLDGQLPMTLGFLSSIIQIDLRDNHIWGSIPSSLPHALRTIDFSGNKLTGQLPSSMGNLTSLSTLHLQNNKLIGKLDVLEDLPLIDLNIENNLFSGPIPQNLLRIRNFRKEGNSFNTTILPSPLVPSPLFSRKPAPPNHDPSPLVPSPLFSSEPAPPNHDQVVPLPRHKSRYKLCIMLWTVVTILVILVACLLHQCYQKRRRGYRYQMHDIEMAPVMRTLAHMDSSNFSVDSGTSIGRSTAINFRSC